jgi:glutathione S-transferase
MPMNVCRSFPGRGRTPEVFSDIARIEAIWAEAPAAGPYLYGADFTAADAMFAPVVTRFLTYGAELSARAAAYCAAVRAHPLVDEWYRAAAEEPAAWMLEKYET